jgi:hypothetical protein
VISELAKVVKRENKDNTRLNAIQRYLETCYERPSLSIGLEKTSVLSELSQQTKLYLAEAGSHMDRARRILSSETIPNESIALAQALSEVQGCILNVRRYREAKTQKFEVLKNFVDEFWVDLPNAFQESFDVWVKELIIGVAQEDPEKQFDFLVQDVLQNILKKAEMDVAIGKELVYELAESYEILRKASLNFIASVFNQEVTEEDTLELSVDENVSGLPELYEVDFYMWTQQQTEFLRQENWSCLDVPNLIEEIESLGRQERQQLENRLGVLLGHLLKWEFQANERSKSWFSTIREQRFRILKLLKENPSLKPFLLEAMEDAYQIALSLAVRETSLTYKAFPKECPYSSEQALNSKFFPGQEFGEDWE